MMNNKSAVVMKMFFVRIRFQFEKNLFSACFGREGDDHIDHKNNVDSGLTTQMMIFRKSRPAQSMEAWQEALVSAGGSLGAPNWV